MSTGSCIFNNMFLWGRRAEKLRIGKFRYLIEIFSLALSCCPSFVSLCRMGISLPLCPCWVLGLPFWLCFTSNKFRMRFLEFEIILFQIFFCYLFKFSYVYQHLVNAFCKCHRVRQSHNDIYLLCPTNTAGHLMYNGAKSSRNRTISHWNMYKISHWTHCMKHGSQAFFRNKF